MLRDELPNGVGTFNFGVLINLFRAFLHERNAGRYSQLRTFN